MHARIPLLALAFVVAASAPAAAGDASDPEITDPTGDAGAGASFGDITAAWVTEKAYVLEGTMQLAELPAQPVGDTYMLLADVGGVTYAWGLFRAVPDFYWYGPWERGTGPAGALEAGDGTLTPGTPGTITFTLPKAYINGTAGAALTRLTAVTELCICGSVGPVPAPLQPGVSEQVFDTAEGRDFTLAAGTPVFGPASPNGTAAGNATSGVGGARPTPGLEPWLAVSFLAALALAARRR